ncbi:MAG: hypothetical protein FWC97_03260 [Treponema sp.]|nr:hypothetical protein [Treponema sp.]
MKVQGCDCSIVIKTAHKEYDIPYAEETVREAISLLHEEASIEGDGVCRATVKKSGVTGCVVTPLTIGTAPLLLYLAMGSAGLMRNGVPMFVSETRDLYKYDLTLSPLEDADRFGLIQSRGNGDSGVRRLFDGCGVIGFELRFLRNETVKLKLDITSEKPPAVFSNTDTFERENGERFSGDNVSCLINGKEYKNIYGLTLSVKKEGGTRTELWIKRSLEKSADLPHNMEELVITAQLAREKYEPGHYGLFRITLKKLVLISDETNVNSVDAVIAPLRFYVSGTVSTEVFASNGRGLT